VEMAGLGDSSKAKKQPEPSAPNASKQHVHGKFHILSLKKQIHGDLKAYLIIEMSLNNA